jgi:hypothetical protein
MGRRSWKKKRVYGVENNSCKEVIEEVLLTPSHILYNIEHSLFTHTIDIDTAQNVYFNMR